jgi:hypothetical protein
LHTADLLAASNLPQVAAATLRQAEAQSNSFSAVPAAQVLAGQLAKQLGAKQIFATVPVVEVPGEFALAKLPYWSSPEQIQNSENLAVQMKKFGAFKPYGLSIEGDVRAYKGDKEAAIRAYRESATLHPSPSIDYRMRAVGRPSTVFQEPKGGLSEGDRDTIQRSFPRDDRSRFIIPAPGETRQ